jgi:hypothetical protein
MKHRFDKAMFWEMFPMGPNPDVRGEPLSEIPLPERRQTIENK